MDVQYFINVSRGTDMKKFKCFLSSFTMFFNDINGLSLIPVGLFTP